MTKKRNVVLVICLVLATALISVGGTLAWLTDTSKEVKNTFSTTTINIDLNESPELDLVMVPGKIITKDPVVTVEANSEACWLFVEVTEAGDFNEFMTYEIADGWTALSGTNTVYYRAVGTSGQDQDFHVIANDQVTVETDVTKEDMDNVGENKPTLTFKAYAVQMAGFEENPAGAWAERSAN